MLSNFWITFLYQPVFNALIFIYQTIGAGNMGWSVIWLTIFLRLILLPFNIISERNNIRHERAVAEAERAIVAFKNDKIAQAEEARKIMRKYRISPWAKVIMLVVQVVMFILLYQVFIHGITGERMVKTLYPFVELPGYINPFFFGFDIGKTHDVVWAGICAFYLFVSIFIEYRNLKKGEKPDLLYWFGFPAFMFLALWYLPMVKSLFILTSMIFSDIITIIRKLAFAPKKPSGDANHH